MKKRKKYVAIMCAALLAFSSLLQGCGKTETVSENFTQRSVVRIIGATKHRTGQDNICIFLQFIHSGRYGHD